MKKMQFSGMRKELGRDDEDERCSCAQNDVTRIIRDCVSLSDI